MRTTKIKLLRELKRLRWQGLGIGVVMACGVAIAIMSLSTLDSLQRTREDYFERFAFPDVFVRLKRAPNSLATRIAELPGVAVVETRVVAAATLDMPGLAEPASAVLISVPLDRTPRLNRLHLRRGRTIERGTASEALVSEAFAEAHHLAPGDRVRVVMNGRRCDLRVVGVALSPEYIYSVRPGELLPDDKRFGVLWMDRDELAAAYDLDQAFNDVGVQLSRGASQFETIRRLDRLLDPYGGTGAFGREDQPSYRFLDNELVQLRAMATLPPLIFLSVTAFLLHLVLARTIDSQREQIATLRAFGYRRSEIARHYLGFAVVLSALGTSVGVALGVFLARDLTALYSRFFRFPDFAYHLDLAMVLAVVGASVAAAALGVWTAVRRAALKSPAQAMQPEAPARHRQSMLERSPLGSRLSPTLRMSLRRLERRPLRAALSCLGIALSIGILVLGEATQDMVDLVMEVQFYDVQRQDVMLTLVEPGPGRALHDLERLAGVRHVEPFRAAPVRLTFGPATRRLALLGLAGDRRLFRPLDVAGRGIDLPAEGVVLSQKLADLLGCKTGDWLQVAVLERARPVRRVRVAGLVADFLDLNAYMRIDALHRLLREQDAISGAFLSVDENGSAALYAELKSMPRVSGVAVRQASIDSYRKTMAENLLRMKAINLAFAAAVACGVVYNIARISLAEQNRELATLRVLGYTRRETAQVLYGELTALTVAAIPVGCGLGYLFAGLLSAALATEVHRFPLHVSLDTFVYSAAVVVASAAASALVVREHIRRLDTIGVLKAKD